MIDFIFFLIPREKVSKLRMSRVKLVAHRGWHRRDILENTLESFEMAVKNKLFGIEFDIRWTKDGVPIVHHDSNCLRVWGKDIIIAETSFSSLRQSLPDIPSLEEVVAFFGRKIHFFIELKDETFKNEEVLKKTLSNHLSTLTPLVDFHLIALSLKPIQVFDTYPPQSYLLVAETNTLEMSRLALIHQLGGVMGYYLFCSELVHNKHREANQKIGTGFIRTVNCLKRELNRDIEWVFTNHPWNLVSFIES